MSAHDHEAGLQPALQRRDYFEGWLYALAASSACRLRALRSDHRKTWAEAYHDQPCVTTAISAWYEYDRWRSALRAGLVEHEFAATQGDAVWIQPDNPPFMGRDRNSILHKNNRGRGAPTKTGLTMKTRVISLSTTEKQTGTDKTARNPIKIVPLQERAAQAGMDTRQVRQRRRAITT